jgi:hypothetical protein
VHDRGYYDRKLRAALAPWFDHPSLQGLLRRRISVVATEADRSSSDDRANDENAHDSLPRQNSLGISLRRFEAVSGDLWDTAPAQCRSQKHPILFISRHNGKASAAGAVAFIAAVGLTDSRGVGFGRRPIPVANVTANQRLLCRLIERPSCIRVGPRIGQSRGEASMTPLGASAVIGVACKKPGRGGP